MRNFDTVTKCNLVDLNYWVVHISIMLTFQLKIAYVTTLHWYYKRHTVINVYKLLGLPCHILLGFSFLSAWLIKLTEKNRWYSQYGSDKLGKAAMACLLLNEYICQIRRIFRLFLTRLSMIFDIQTSIYQKSSRYCFTREPAIQNGSFNLVFPTDKSFYFELFQ